MGQWLPDLSESSGLHPYRSIASGPQKGPAERGHVKKRQKYFSTLFDIFRAGQKSSKSVKNNFSTLFDNFRAAPVFRSLLGGSDIERSSLPRGLSVNSSALILSKNSGVSLATISGGP